MKMQAIGPDLLPKVVNAMGQTRLFKGIDVRHLGPIAQQGLLAHYADGETIATQGEKADAVHIVLNGRVAVHMVPEGLEEKFEIARLEQRDTFGETEMMLRTTLTRSYTASGQALVLKFADSAFDLIFERIATFGMHMSRLFAERVNEVSPKVPLPLYEVRDPPKEADFALVPLEFIQRNRCVPLATRGNVLILGFVDDLTPHLVNTVRAIVPGMELQPVRLAAAAYDRLMQSFSGGVDLSASVAAVAHPSTPTVYMGPGPGGAPAAPASAVAGGMAAPGGTPPRGGPRMAGNPKLDALLKRMVAEGASDLHLSAGHKPRWRIDGEICEISDAKVLGPDTVYELFEPITPQRNLWEFQTNDTDFAYAIKGLARFRVNIFRDNNGVGAVMRQIPDKILTLEQLGMPRTVQRMCDHPKGLVLVTGPTGSGKSTTLAAMVDYINRTRRTHIITMEDPIEFVHKSQKALVNQREVGPHTESFARALRASLREDPDIVLVGEMRDVETVSLALETANTGHLVFGTLHTSTAISTVDRIIDLFPHEQQSQVRAVAADVLKGVVAQTLCRKRGGGRIAALEILVGSMAVSNLIRERKNHQIANIMMTSKKMGNMMLNEQLQQLVIDGLVEYEEALAKAIDKPELAKRFGREYFDEEPV